MKCCVNMNLGIPSGQLYFWDVLVIVRRTSGGPHFMSLSAVLRSVDASSREVA